jgi:hypothetical protein
MVIINGTETAALSSDTQDALDDSSSSALVGVAIAIAVVAVIVLVAGVIVIRRIIKARATSTVVKAVPVVATESATSATSDAAPVELEMQDESKV